MASKKIMIILLLMALKKELDFRILQDSDHLRISQAPKDYHEKALNKYSSAGNPSKSLMSLLIIYF